MGFSLLSNSCLVEMPILDYKGKTGHCHFDMIPIERVEGSTTRARSLC